MTSTLTGGTETVGTFQITNGIERVYFPEYHATPTLAVLKQWWNDDLIDLYKRYPGGEEEEYFHA